MRLGRHGALPGLAVLLASSALFSQPAFDRAPRTADGRVIVDNLIIGCTTHRPAQVALERYYHPLASHRHEARAWVSFDQDPGLVPDICASVEELERHVAQIRSNVYIEHLNDVTDQPLCWTYQGALLRKLHGLMAPGARLFMDLYPMAGLYDDTPDLDRGYADFEDHPYRPSPATGVDPSDSPFWFQASVAHFAQAVQPGSIFDDFRGREAVLWDLVEAMGELPQPGGLAHQVDHLLRAACATLDQRLEAPDPLPGLHRSMGVFYATRLEPHIVDFPARAGFRDPAIIRCKPANPFNGRKGEKMLVATR